MLNVSLVFYILFAMLKEKFKNLTKLKVRAKLLLLLAIPGFAISYFSYKDIITENTALQQIEESIELMKAAVVLSNGIYKIQKERDLSYNLATNQDIRKRNILKAQRHETDEKIKDIKVHFTAFDEFYQHVEGSELNDIISTFDNVIETRKILDNNPSSTTVFPSFSEIIQVNLNFIQYIKSSITDSAILNEANSYYDLSLLQERAGQERAIINRVLTTGKLDIDTYSNIKYWISEQDNIIDYYYISASKQHIRRLYHVLSRLDNQEVIDIRKETLRIAIKNQLLNEIQTTIGYGGLIHNFKNYVLRGKKEYNYQFNDKYDYVRTLIIKYQQLEKLSVNELKHLNNLNDVLNQYQLKLPLIQKMIKEKRPPSEIDQKIEIDDAPALLAVEALKLDVNKFRATNWWQSATSRIKSIKQVADEIALSVLKHSRQILKANTFNYRIKQVLVTFVIFTLLYLSFFLIKRVVIELGLITKIMNRMHQTGNFNKLLQSKGNDEITQMVNAFNALIVKQNDNKEEMQHLAYYDDLTSLPNRKSCLEDLQLQLDYHEAGNKKFALMYIDLDRFKYINDTLGHYMGDVLLQQSADRLRQCIGKKDLLSRIGGDEFVILLADVKSKTSIKVAGKKILNTFGEFFQLSKTHRTIISASIGIANYPDDGKDVVSLLKNADTAMYQAKEKGKNQFLFFTEKMNLSVMQSMKVEQDLHKALIYQQFELYYQPVIDLKTKKVLSAEALIRWNDPDVGLRYPDEFISIAEETGLIVPIGIWVIQTAVKQAEEWREKYKNPIEIAINVSIRQFMDSSHPVSQIFAEALESQTDKSHLIGIEITENLLIESESNFKEVLNDFNKMGINIYMDDFGTGYSSLSNLKKYPIDVLKIDGSFIKEIDKNEDDRRLVESIINMGKIMKIKVLAEWVETREHETLLEEIGCDMAQGFLYSKPVPAKEFAKKHLKNKI